LSAAQPGHRDLPSAWRRVETAETGLIIDTIEVRSGELVKTLADR